MWRVSLPTDRLVIYYGNPFSSAMGPLGAYSDDELLAKLRQQAQAYADLDPQHPVVPAFDYVTPVAQASATADGTWRARMPDDSIEHYRNWPTQIICSSLWTCRLPIVPSRAK